VDALKDFPPGNAMRRFVPLALACFLASTIPAAAQGDGWQADLAPLYGWLATTSGNIAVNGAANVPVYLDFADAKDKLTGIFSFHGEVRHRRWGVIGDVFFIRLSTDVNYTIAAVNAPIAGTFKLDETLFDGEVTYQVRPSQPFYLVGGVRTATMSPTVHLTGPVGGTLADLNPSKTKAAAIGGFIYRPKLGKHAVLLTRADIGGGSAFTWSAMGGVELLVKPWMGVAVGYNALGVDTGSVPKNGTAPVKDLEFSVTQYGPVFALTFHIGQQ
jgi:hypothetical protein